MASNWKIKGSTSIIFFHFGDDKLTTFFQQIGVKLSGAFDGYDRKILLRESNKFGGYELNQQAVDKADQILAPTRDNLVKAIKDAAKDGHLIDLFILGHGGKANGGDFTALGKDVSGKFLMQELGKEATGYHELPIRMVYQMNCYGSLLNEEWTSLGAKVSLGARYVNFYPNQFNGFVQRWNDGKDVEECRDECDDPMSRTAVQLYIATIHAPSTKGVWGGCPLFKTVLGDHPCAKKYFVSQWLAASEWQSDMSGKENMNHSSFKKIRGDRDIKKTSTPTWIRQL